MIDITQIVVALIGLLSTVITVFLIPVLRNKLTDKQNEIFDSVVRVGVYAAEQIFGAGRGNEKKEYVVNLLNERGYDVNSEIVDAAIEAAVKELSINVGN